MRDQMLNGSRTMAAKVRWALGLAALATLLLPLSAQAGPRRVVIVRHAPKIVAVVRPPAPKPRKKVWVPGHYKVMPSGRRVWVPGHWKVLYR